MSWISRVSMIVAAAGLASSALGNCSSEGGGRAPLAADDLWIDLSDGSSLQLTFGSDAYRVHRDGGVIASGDSPRAIMLSEGAFDPLHDPVRRLSHGLLLASLAERHEHELWLVQLRAPTLQPMLEAIEAAGGRVASFFPDGAFVVRMDEPSRERVSALPFVRWVGEYAPDYRTVPEIRQAIADAAFGQGESPQGSRRYSIQTAFTGMDETQSLVGAIAAVGGLATLVQPQSIRMEAELTPLQLARLLRHPGLLFVDEASEPQNDMSIVRDSTGANYLETVAGFTGQGVRGEVMDSGLLTTHQEFTPNPAIIHAGNSGDPYHGTQCYSIVFARGVNTGARGMLPDAQGIFASYSNVGNRFVHTQQLTQAPYHAVFQSNSWGFNRTRQYTTASAEMDNIIFVLDFLICQSQSNAGNQDSRPQAWAKNIVSVGGYRHYNTLSEADDMWTFSASTGPALDGRIKPDLSHFYDFTLAASNTGIANYENFGGTSGATPITAGHFGLLFQMWSQGIFGNPVSGGSVFEERPRAITAKALMINAARPFAVNNQADDKSRIRQGWGRPDVQRLYDKRNETFVINGSVPILPLSTHAYIANVASTDQLRVTLAYADPAGNPSAVLARVNDLDLRVTSPDGRMYWGNFGLLGSNFSAEGGQPSRVDTVENVIIASPIPGDWLLEVYAREINQDGRTSTPALDADYALVVTGAQTAPAPLAIVLHDDFPEVVSPDAPTPLTVRFLPAAGIQQATLHVRTSGGSFSPIPMTPMGAGVFAADLPPQSCSGPALFYFSGSSNSGSTTLPSLGAAAPFMLPVAQRTLLVNHHFNAGPSGWTVTNFSLADGAWEWGVPVGGGTRHDPPTAPEGFGACWLTRNAAGNTDVDGGPTICTSPAFDLSGAVDPVLEIDVWLSCDDASNNEEDRMTIQFSSDNGQTWVNAQVIRSTWVWSKRRYRILDRVPLTSTFRVRLSVEDVPNNSTTEAAFDNVRIYDYACVSSCSGDLSGSADPSHPGYGVPDGTVDASDFFYYLDQFTTGNLAVADLTGSSNPNDPSYGIPDGNLDAADFFYYLDLFVAGCP
ncbi:MAG: S8 family serine peptidase [Phycisphaeraceae bacterium]|nr:S8 family serine peptidase [Phycisphaeraceae bacterium]